VSASPISGLPAEEILAGRETGDVRAFADLGVEQAALSKAEVRRNAVFRGGGSSDEKSVDDEKRERRTLHELALVVGCCARARSHDGDLAAHLE